VALGLTTAVALAAWQQLQLDGLVAWLLAVNLVTVLAYGYDKWVAGSKLTRVPELVLLALALAGGTPGALLGMRAFHHKTAKESFRLKFWLVVLVQLAVVAGYYRLAWD
jgi:uncharacterized membrane protein YsdA (DUF1294 family)